MMRRLRVEGVARRDDHPVVVLREFGRERVRLCLFPTPAEAHALEHELAARETMRSQAHRLLDSALRAVGARPAAVQLWRSCDACVAARLLIERDGTWSSVDAETTQAVALAGRLRLPLWAEPGLFEGAAGVPARKLDENASACRDSSG